MGKMVAMAERTARKVAGLLRESDGKRVTPPSTPQINHRSQLLTETLGSAIANVIIVRGIPEGGEYETTLRVQRAALTEENQWAATGETFNMPTFPLMPAICWQKFIVPEGSVPEFMGDIQPTRTIGGVECVELFVPLFPVTIRSDDPYRGPRPA
ncbi:MAG: hypothetical protein KAV00_02060 [Phycisphaerae bacterium]|nr:hypothetical protein [Phycisphaerae bacterium]